MENFVVYTPTKLYFGKGVLNKLSKNVSKYGKKALIIYGKKSAKAYGYFDNIIQELKKASIEEYVEYGGIKPNPIVDDVRNAVKLCKEANVDFIIAVGGGSVIDSAKIVSLSYANDFDAWDIVTEKVQCTKRVPLIVVLTLAATGSEMNPFAVIQSSEAHQKIGFYSPLIYPDESYLDPSYTITVPKNHTAYGIADILVHALEAYFACGDAPLADKMVGAVIKEIMEVAPLVLNNLDNYEYRARVMWASTVALNGTLYYGRKGSGDWGIHSIGHVLSYLFDTPHGATLSVVSLAWMKHLKDKIEDRLEYLGYLITGKKVSANETIKIFEKFFKSIECPVKLEDINVCVSDLPNIKQYIEISNANGDCYNLGDEDFNQILNLML